MRSKMMMAARLAAAASLALFLVFSAHRADATILFAGGEDIDFNQSPLCVDCGFNTGASLYRGSWSRGALRTKPATSAPRNYWLSKPFTAAASIWTHAQVFNDGAGSPQSSSWLISVWSPDGTPSIVIRSTGTGFQLRISKIDESGTLTDLTTCPATFPADGQLQQFDMFLNYAVSGEVTLYNNGVQFCDYTGDVTTNSRTQVNQIALGAIGSADAYWSEIVVATTDTRAVNLLTLAPNANGNAQQWAGASPCTAILNAITFNDTSYVSTSTNNQIEQCKITGTIPAGAYNVDAVVTSMRGLVGSSGPQHIEYNLRTGGSDFFSSDITPTNAFSNLPSVIWPLNPATSSAWATTDLSNAGFNIGIKSTP